MINLLEDLIKRLDNEMINVLEISIKRIDKEKAESDINIKKIFLVNDLYLLAGKIITYEKCLNELKTVVDKIKSIKYEE